MSPIKKQVSLLRKVMPKAKRVGIMYTTSERNSEVQVKQAKKIFQEAGIKTSVKGISSTNDVQDTAKSLMSKTDVLFVPTDNNYSQLSNAVRESIERIKSACCGRFSRYGTKWFALFLWG